MIMPSFAALLVKIGSFIKAGPESAYTSVLVGQCLLAGLNSLLIFRISRRLGFSRTLSCAGGLAWGLYPRPSDWRLTLHERAFGSHNVTHFCSYYSPPYCHGANRLSPELSPSKTCSKPLPPACH
jgi:hypothetical protein